MIFVRENGTKVEQAALDGYAFGERQMEGVYFFFEIEDGKITCVEWGDEETRKAYLCQFDRDYWFLQAESFAEDNDIFYVVEDGKVTEEECWCDPPNFTPVQGRAIEIKSAKDIFGS